MILSAVKDSASLRAQLSQRAAPPIRREATAPAVSQAPAGLYRCACGGGCPRCQSETPVQTKLAVSQPGDHYEQEADSVAEQVMRMPETHGATAPAAPAEAGAQTGAGEPLTESAKAFFEPRFNQDFSGVRIHTDTRAAQSASRVDALAYTFGRDIVFGAGMYKPETPEGKKLLAHELTHVVQQRGSAVNSSARPHVQRQAKDPDKSGPCEATRSEKLIEPAFTEARKWRKLAAAWLEKHIDHIRAKGSSIRNDYVKLGSQIFDELKLLELHFRISDEMKISFPYSADDMVTASDLEKFAAASYWVRRRFREVETAPSFLCQTNCPRAKKGSDVLGSAGAGTKEVTFYTNCFDRQHENTRAGVALHEIFHASFYEFDHDTYSFEKSYPGDKPMTNAESYATFAANVATGGNYRIKVLPEIIIHGGGE